ncbi:MAG: CopG family transcriptional regulator [Lysobacteraceae bacterium]
MRTTLTLDDDVQALLKQAMRAQGRSFKQVLNDALRRALAPVPAAIPAFKQQRFPMGEPRVDLTKALALSGELEDQGTLARYQYR